MNREKQIEEMSTVINEMDGRNAHYYDKYMEECEAFADADAIAKALYNAGYRKTEIECSTDTDAVEVVRCKDCKHATFYSCKNDACYKGIICEYQI